MHHSSYTLQVVWCWILGTTMCFTLGTSIAEIVSAYPTCGGLWERPSSRQQCLNPFLDIQLLLGWPLENIVQGYGLYLFTFYLFALWNLTGWVGSWLVKHPWFVFVSHSWLPVFLKYCMLLGQIAGVSSTEFGLSNMIWAAVVIGKVGKSVVLNVKNWHL